LNRIYHDYARKANVLTGAFNHALGNTGSHFLG
jgi:hypothetical protein